MFSFSPSLKAAIFGRHAGLRIGAYSRAALTLLTLTRPFLRAFVTDRVLLFCRSRKARRRLSHPATRSYR